MLNLFNQPIKSCSMNPITGYRRDGFCHYFSDDYGTHIVCALVDDKFLKFTKSKGNDLISANYNFPGLKSGDKWCICIGRWLEAYEAGVAPKIDPYASSKLILNYISFEEIKKFFI
jgi:uncharacterized protein (DUF2237 family)